MRIPPSSFATPPAQRGPSMQLPKSEKALAQTEPKTTPPGLERALARLQSRSEPNAGQSNASDRISRNLARYAENQNLSAAPVEPATPAPMVPADPPAAEIDAPA